MNLQSILPFVHEYHTPVISLRAFSLVYLIIDLVLAARQHDTINYALNRCYSKL